MSEQSHEELNVKKARRAFMQGRAVKPGLVRPEVLESWKRSKAFGIDPDMRALVDTLTREQVSALLKKNQLFISCAKNILKNFFNLIKNDDSAMLILDREAHILTIMGDGEHWKKHNRMANVRIGSCLLERCVGTTPVTLSLMYDRPFEISGEEYFTKIWFGIRDFSVPIHDELGTIIGTIELSVSKESPLNYSHTFALVVAIAGIIENQLQLMKAMEQKDFFSNSMTASMASLEEGLIVLGLDESIVHVNPYIERMLGVRLENVINRNIRQIIKNPMLLEAIDNKVNLTDHEVIMDEAINRQRYLVSVNPVLGSTGKRIGYTLVFKEFKSIQALVQRVAGLSARHTFDDILGESPAIKNVIRMSRVVSKSSSNIMIIGESGTGKELLAQSIHNASVGSTGPFMAINCAAFPSDIIESEVFGYEPGTFTGGLQQGKPGKLELANGGTLFLDELNGMSLDMQVKLLRVLEERQFQRLGGKRYINLNAKIISATNQDLRERVLLGNFRSDLYYRLAVVEIQIPPLRLRKQDIEIYIRHFIREMNERLGRSVRGCSPDAMDYLMSYSWPGNVRELRNWIERAVNLAESDLLAPGDFPSPMTVETVFVNPKVVSDTSFASDELNMSVELAECNKIKSALAKYAGNRELVSKHLGIGRATLYRKIRKYGLGSSRQMR